MSSHLRSFGGRLRYNQDEIEELIEGANMQWSTILGELLEDSDIGQEYLGKVKQEGREEGRADGARRMLRRVLKTRFAGLETRPELDQLDTVERLEALLDTIASAADRPAAEAAIRAAAERS